MPPKKKKCLARSIGQDGFMSRGIQRIPSSSKLHIHQHFLTGDSHSEDIVYLTDETHTEVHKPPEPDALGAGDLKMAECVQEHYMDIDAVSSDAIILTECDMRSAYLGTPQKRF
jgi:hypothetical protein